MREDLEELSWGDFLGGILGAMPQGLILQAFSLLGGKEPERLKHQRLRRSLKM